MVANTDRYGSGAFGFLDRDNAKLYRRAVHLYTFLMGSFMVLRQDSNVMARSGAG